MIPELQSEEYRRFSNALRQVLSVSKGELNRRIEEDREAKADRPKRGPKPKSSDHVSSDKD